MGGLRKRKGTCGEATKYITRNKAVKMLQLKLVDFRKLCILKGVYPREPKSRKKAQKGDQSLKTLFLKSDIRFLAAEEIIGTMRAEKTFSRKLGKYKQLREGAQIKRMKKHKPKYTIDHIVLERYPDFRSALQELDDALCSIFLYASLPKSLVTAVDLTRLCRRLSTEFLLYVIQARALRKVFVTVKGYYYRANIDGQDIMWVIPHPFRAEVPLFVDMKIMNVFLRFYTTFVGFVNFKLYQGLDLTYPPKLAQVDAELPRRSRYNKSEVNEKHSENINVIATLNRPIQNLKDIEEIEEESYDMSLMNHDEEYKKRVFFNQTEQVEIEMQKRLFEGKKFFLGRETNRESLTFIIRSAGGLVSWEESADYGSSYPEDDKDIEYQIVDRKVATKKYLSRYYIQPQWVYDSFNFAILLPVQKYFVGVDLPAHISPFEEENNLYRKFAPEELKIKALKNKLRLVGENVSDDDDDEYSDIEDGNEQMDEEVKENEDEDGKALYKIKEDRAAVKDLSEEEQAKQKTADLLASVAIKRCKPYGRFKEALAEKRKRHDFKLAATFIHRKQKRTFKKVCEREKSRNNRMEMLKRRRMLYEKEMRKQKTTQRSIKMTEKRDAAIERQ